LSRKNLTVIALSDPPFADRGPIDGYIGTAVGVKIGRNGFVACQAERNDVDRKVGRTQNEPESGRGPENSKVGFSVAIIICR